MSKSHVGIAKLIGRRVRQLRYAHGWDQSELEAELDGLVTRSAISTYETGKSLPSLSVLLHLADVFGVPPATLLFEPEASDRGLVAYAALTASQQVLTRLKKVLARRE